MPHPHAAVCLPGTSSKTIAERRGVVVPRLKLPGSASTSATSGTPCFHLHTPFLLQDTLCMSCVRCLDAGSTGDC